MVLLEASFGHEPQSPANEAKKHRHGGPCEALEPKGVIFGESIAEIVK